MGPDPGVDVEQVDASLAGEEPTEMLVRGVLLVGAAGIAVEGEEGLGGVFDGKAVVPEVLDDVGPAEIPGDAGVDGDVDDVAGADRTTGVARQDLLDDRLAHDAS